MEPLGTDNGLVGPKDGVAGPVELCRAVFERTRLAYAHGQAIYRDEETVDAVFLETNRAFETATGLRQVAGRRVSEVIPDFLATSPGLLATLGRVAESGCPETFETHVQALDSWFAMHVFSPAPGQFVAALENITERRQAVEEGEDERRRLEDRLTRAENLELKAAKAARCLEQMLAGILDTAAEREPAAAGPDQEAFRYIGQVCLEAMDRLKAMLTPERPAPDRKPPREEPAAPKPCPVPRKVLLVDDDEDVRFLMGRMLKKAGVLHVATAAGGEDALASLAVDLPDLVILDQNMPGMSGVQALGRIRELHPDLPVLFSSGQPDLHEWGALEQERVAVIAKPFTVADIQARLHQFEQTSRQPH
ncbi:MAG: response regulator [Holophaga sp.]|nr:response regulator [Holophaga sp.]